MTFYDFKNRTRYLESFRIFCCKYCVSGIFYECVVIVMKKPCERTRFYVSTEKFCHRVTHFCDIERMFIAIEKYMVTDFFHLQEILILNDGADDLENVLGFFESFLSAFFVYHGQYINDRRIYGRILLYILQSIFIKFWIFPISYCIKPSCRYCFVIFYSIFILKKRGISEAYEYFSDNILSF